MHVLADEASIQSVSNHELNTKTSFSRDLTLPCHLCARHQTQRRCDHALYSDAINPRVGLELRRARTASICYSYCSFKYGSHLDVGRVYPMQQVRNHQGMRTRMHRETCMQSLHDDKRQRDDIRINQPANVSSSAFPTRVGDCGVGVPLDKSSVKSVGVACEGEEILIQRYAEAPPQYQPQYNSLPPLNDSPFTAGPPAVMCLRRQKKNLIMGKNSRYIETILLMRLMLRDSVSDL